MPKRTNDFQRLVKRIHTALAGTAAEVEESALVKEKNSSAQREVDVLISTTVAGHKIRVAIECRDHTRGQDITWIDSLIGKYTNLDVDKVIAVSHTPFGNSAVEKAQQNNIEVLTLEEAGAVDWVEKICPSEFRSFAFRNRPLVVGLQLDSIEQLVVRYEFDGTIKDSDEDNQPIAQFFLDVWHSLMSQKAGQMLSQEIFGNWERVASLKQTPRYWEITESYVEPRTLSIAVNNKVVCFNTVVWGVGTKYSMETVEPGIWVIKNNAAIIASFKDDQGHPVHITLVTDMGGQLVGVDVDAS